MAKRRQFSSRPFMFPENTPLLMMPARLMPTPYPVPSLAVMGKGDAAAYQYNPQATLRDIGRVWW